MKERHQPAKYITPTEVLAEYRRLNPTASSYIERMVGLYPDWTRETLTPAEIGRLIWYFDRENPTHISWQLTQGGSGRRVKEVAQKYLSLRENGPIKEWGKASLVEEKIEALGRGERVKPLIIVKGHPFPSGPESSFIDGVHRSLAIVVYSSLTGDEDLKTEALVGKVQRHRPFPRLREKGSLGKAAYQLACRLHKQAPKGEAYLNSKLRRGIDSAGLVALTIPGALIILAEASYVALCDKVWPFYAHQCIGKDNQKFGRLKIRTMIQGADEISGYEVPMVSKSPIDPRVIHRRLRAFSLDEFPQLINVLRGEMSLIGPTGRPQIELDYFEKMANQQVKLKPIIEEFLNLYLKVRPGISGIQQIMGRGNLTPSETARIEGWYLKNASWIVDLGIAWGTISAVLSKQGAF